MSEVMGLGRGPSKVAGLQSQLGCSLPLGVVLLHKAGALRLERHQAAAGLELPEALIHNGFL
jgi:hypothetical protein